MAGRILTYIFGVILTLYMAVLYKSAGLVFVFYSELFIGSILLIINIIVFLNLEIQLKTEHVLRSDNQIKFEIIIKNKSIFQSGKISITLTCLDPYTMKKKKVTVEQFCAAQSCAEKKEEKNLYSFRDKDGGIISGKYVIFINKISVYDYLGIFKLTKNGKNKNRIECVVPVIEEKETETTDSSREESDNIINVNTSNDGDFSCVRQYRNGDRLNNIHWKLSSKNDEIYVKEFYDENEFCYCYYIETKPLSRKEIAGEFVKWFEAAAYVIGQGETILFLWYSPEQMCVKKVYVSNEEELYNALCEINVYEGKDKSVIIDMDMLMEMEKRV